MPGVSRTPLREALKVLAAEGLIDLLPNRGARVRQLSEKDLRELFDVLAGLEALAGRLACETITDEVARNRTPCSRDAQLLPSTTCTSYFRRTADLGGDR